MSTIVVIIPVLNEEASIGRVLSDIPDELQARVIVVDNGSTDETVRVAQAHGAIVVHEPERGYGSACLRGIKEARHFAPDIIVFLDGDYSDYPEEMPALIDALKKYDLVIGSRVTGHREQGALLPQARFGNWLSTWLIHLLWNVHFTDLGPFRAIRYEALTLLNMQDRNYGWTVEMQIRAAQCRLRCTEIPVSYRKRIGQSKVTGTLKGSFMAGIIILRTITLHAWRNSRLRFRVVRTPETYIETDGI